MTQTHALLDRMRIAYLITRSDTVGGAHVHVRDLSLALLDAGHEVCVMVGQEGPFTHELSRRGIAHQSVRNLVRQANPWRDLRALWEIRSALASFAPDIVSTHSSKAGCLGRMAAASLGLPVIFTAHGWAFTDGVSRPAARLYRTAERCLAPLATRVITVSDYDRALALRGRVVPPQKLITVHNGMPDIPACLYARPELTPVRLTMIARFEEQKDHATLLRALGGLTQYAWDLDLIGDGPLRHLAERIVSVEQLGGRVRFLGLCHNIAERLAESQIFLLISNWEGFPRSILEAMRARLPVVASDVGGSSESVVENETGFLVPRGDVATLRNRLARLFTDPALRVRLGQGGRKRYEEQFTLGVMLEKTLRVYSDITSKQAGDHHDWNDHERLAFRASAEQLPAILSSGDRGGRDS